MWSTILLPICLHLDICDCVSHPPWFCACTLTTLPYIPYIPYIDSFCGQFSFPLAMRFTCFRTSLGIVVSVLFLLLDYFFLLDLILFFFFWSSSTLILQYDITCICVSAVKMSCDICVTNTTDVWLIRSTDFILLTTPASGESFS